MTPTDPTPLRAALRSALAAAMARRDRAALAVYRTAISAIDNAEAAPLADEHRAGALEAAPGVGQADVPRRPLTTQEELDVVRGEVQERRVAAGSLAATNPDAARRLHDDADLLQTLLDGLAAADDGVAAQRSPVRKNGRVIAP